MANNNKNIYSPEFIPYYISDVNKLWLSPLEWLCYWFIRFYCTKNKFFFSSEDFSSILQTSTGTIDNIISRLVKIWIITTKTKRHSSWWIVKSIREIKLNNKFLFSLNDENTSSSNDEIKENIVNKKDNKQEIILINNSNDLREYYSTIEDKFLNKELWKSLCYLIDLWYKIEKTEKALRNYVDWCKDVIKRYLWVTQSWELPYNTFEWKVYEWFTRHSEKKDTISNYKSSLLIFLKPKQ